LSRGVLGPHPSAPRPLLLPLVFLLTPRPPSPPLFPSTTLFRPLQVGPAEVPDARGLCGERAPLRRGEGDCLQVHAGTPRGPRGRSEEHTSELQSLTNLVCRLLLEKKKQSTSTTRIPRQHVKLVE